MLVWDSPIVDDDLHGDGTIATVKSYASQKIREIINDAVEGDSIRSHVLPGMNDMPLLSKSELPYRLWFLASVVSRMPSS